MDCRTALERLACNQEDEEAILSLYQKNFQVFENGIRKYFEGTNLAKELFFTLVFHVASRAKYFLSGCDDPEKWLAEQVDLECQSLRLAVSAANLRIPN